MAIKQVKDYYKQTEKLYFEMVAALKEIQEDCARGEATEEEVAKLLTPVNNLQQEYIRLSYVMHLLMAPRREKKNGAYERQHKEVSEYFRKNGYSVEQARRDDEYALAEFKKAIKEFKELKSKHE